MTDDDHPWLKLAHHAHTGDPAAFEALARPLTYWITRYARARAADLSRAGATVEEIVQNTLMSVWTELQPPRCHHWDSDAHVLAWVHTITTRRISDACRAAARRAHIIMVEDIEQVSTTTNTGIDPSRVVAAADDVARTSTALAQMSPRHRDTVLGHASGEPDHALAARLGITHGSLRVIRTRALATLRRHLNHVSVESQR